MTGKSEELTDFQRWVMTVTGKGAGIDASPGAMTPKERLECEALVDRGMLELGKNHSADKHGMFVRPNVGLGLAKSEDRNMTQEMTGWFSGLVRPTRKGVYQTKANDIPGYLWFNYWNGRRWSSGGYARVEDAHKFRHERQNDDVDYWRGLARPNA